METERATGKGVKQNDLENRGRYEFAVALRLSGQGHNQGPEIFELRMSESSAISSKSINFILCALAREREREREKPGGRSKARIFVRGR